MGGRNKKQGRKNGRYKQKQQVLVCRYCGESNRTKNFNGRRHGCSTQNWVDYLLVSNRFSTTACSKCYKKHKKVSAAANDNEQSEKEKGADVEPAELFEELLAKGMYVYGTTCVCVCVVCFIPTPTNNNKCTG